MPAANTKTSKTTAKAKPRASTAGHHMSVSPKKNQAPSHDAWDSRDPLGTLLHALRMQGVIYTHSQLSGDWGIALPPMPQCVQFHAVTQGQCLLKVPGHPDTLLPTGSFALIPHGQGHTALAHDKAPAIGLFDLPWHTIAPKYDRLVWHAENSQPNLANKRNKHKRPAESNAPTTLVCGAVRFDHPIAMDWLKGLPPLIAMQSQDPTHADWLNHSLALMASEAEAQQPGGETIVTRLADILIIQAIRHWLVQNQNQQTGWFKALHDPSLGPVLFAIHQDPTQPWDLQTLADTACLSRSAFSQLFTQAVGRSPMQHVTHCRMQQAAMWLRDGQTVAQCAHALHYTTEAAFARAFKRTIGQAPGSWRDAQTGE